MVLTVNGDCARGGRQIGSVLSSFSCIIIVMSETDADRFRKQAEECRQQAEKAIKRARQGGVAKDGRRVD
jgi:hypothetical protein